MSRRSDKKAAKAAANNPGQMYASPPPQSSGGRQAFELQVFDGKGHAGVMVFSAGAGNRIQQRLHKGRDWHAHLPQTHK